jgi:exodeoxyribonuclease V alpha subunit
MKTLSDVHQQFASLFKKKEFEPFAYLVSKKLSEGHICLDLKDLDSERDSLPYKSDNEEDILDVGILAGNTDLVSGDENIKKPFILNNDHLYIQRYFAYETIILDRIKKFVETENTEEANRKADLLKSKKFIIDLFSKQPSLENVPPEECVDWQMAAALRAVINNFTIITGGPGTGKTTTVAKILAILFNLNPELRVGLAAPTGKAASRMGESLKIAGEEFSEELKLKFENLKIPLTIYRLLGYVPESVNFKHDKKNPLNLDVVIIDESSMVDVAIFAKLLDAIGENTRLIMLGDRNQLASVEAGSLFGDLCESISDVNAFTVENINFINSFISDNKRQLTQDYMCPKSENLLFEHVVELKRSHRFAGTEGIGKFSRAVMGNNEKEIRYFFDNKDKQISIDTEYSEQSFKDFISGYESYITEPDITKALKKINELRVLCAVRQGEQGIYALNKKIESYLHSRKLIKADDVFYHNRPIIVTSNNYNLGVFNGDVGIIRSEAGKWRAWFEDSKKGIKSVLPAYIERSETVFAMTIHKSQGSEFDKVMVVLPKNKDNKLLTRELLYTAVTRARSNVIIQAKHDIILSTAEQKVKRASGIMDRL